MKIGKICAVYFAFLPATNAASSTNFRGSNVLQDAKTKETMQHIRKDMKKILEAKENKDNEDMEAALFSFYGNRQALKEKGIEGSIVKNFDKKVKAILNMPDIRITEATSSNMELMEQDLQNIMDAKESQDDEGMEAASPSFYKNRKTLKDKGVDESTMKEYDYEVDAILEKKNDRNGDVKNAKELVENDLQNIMDAKNSQDKEDIEIAMRSFYENRKTLKEMGVDKDIIKDFDGVVDSILEKANIRTDESIMEAASPSFYMNRKTLKDKGVDEKTIKEYDYEFDAILEKKNDRNGDVINAIKLVENDIQNIMDAKDKEDKETAMHSFYENRKTLKDIGVDKDIIKDFDREVDAILEKPSKMMLYEISEIEHAIELVENDLQNIYDAKKIQDNKVMKIALNSFYRNRKTLKDIVDEEIVKDFDHQIDAILEKPIAVEERLL